MKSASVGIDVSLFGVFASFRRKIDIIFCSCSSLKDDSFETMDEGSVWKEMSERFLDQSSAESESSDEGLLGAKPYVL